MTKAGKRMSRAGAAAAAKRRLEQCLRASEARQAKLAAKGKLARTGARVCARAGDSRAREGAAAKRTATAEGKRQIIQALRHAVIVETSRRAGRIVRHVDPPAATIRKRRQLEGDLGAWLRFFLPEAFSDPWAPDQERGLAKLKVAIDEGGLFAVAWPRGGGKTTIVKGVALYALVTGRRKYVPSIGATAELGQAIVEWARLQIIENDRLHEFYPHITTYARATDGKAIKARYQLRADGKHSGILWSNSTLVLPDVVDAEGKVYASNGGILEAHGLTGAIRGKWHDTKTGKVVRPDFVLLDDPQTRESAESASQCAMRERIITGDVLGLAGPRRKIAAVMPCTIIRRGDLADRFLDHKLHPEWQGETCPLVRVWPAAQDTLWAEYAALYREQAAQGMGGAAATEFYRARRVEMDAGAVVTWTHRIRNGEISALQTAENLLIESGPQFWAEYQNAPQEATATVYDLSAKLVVSRVDGTRRAGECPAWARILTAGTDINHYGLHTVLTGFGNDHSAGVLWYGRYDNGGHGVVPKNATEAERKRLIFEALVVHGRQLASVSLQREGKPTPIGLWLIDGGYEHETVQRYVQTHGRSLGFPVMVCRGYGFDRYRPYGKSLVGKPREYCHLTDWQLGRGLAFHADYWREVMQRAWLGSVGAPGSCSLFAGREHGEFAEHIAREKLVEKLDGKAGVVWRWAVQPGWHDWGDALYMCYVGAAWMGIGSGGPSRPPDPRRRRPTGITVIPL